MKTRGMFITIIFVLITRIMVAQTNTGTLTLSVTGLRSNNGMVLASLFKSHDGFPHEREKCFQHIKASISKNTSEVIFRNIPLGYYAIGIIHDENNNNKMDFGMFHIPKEGYGASNNAKGTFGPPDFNDAKFNFTSTNNKISININY